MEGLLGLGWLRSVRSVGGSGEYESSVGRRNGGRKRGVGMSVMVYSRSSEELRERARGVDWGREY